MVAYDTEYAMVDRDDDIRLGMRTSAITFGRFDVLAVAVCYWSYFAGMAWLGVRLALMGVATGSGFAIAVAARGLPHLWLIRTRERMRCFRAFLNNHWLGFAILPASSADQAWRYKAWPRAL